MDELDRLWQDRPWRVRVHHERVRADREDALIGGERGMDAARRRREHPRVQRVGGREDAGRVKGRCEDGRSEGLGQRDELARRRRKRTPRRPQRSRPEPIGDSANSVASSSTEAATVRRSIVDAGGTSTSPSASSVDIGSDTNTGPTGGEAASWNARRITVPSSSRVRTSCTHFDTGRASPTRSPDRSGSLTMWRQSCWPAVTTSGEPFATALVRLPIALPKPAEVCRFRNAGRPVACA